MTRYHTTTEGQIPFTAEEEAARDVEEAENVAKQVAFEAEQVVKKAVVEAAKQEILAAAIIRLTYAELDTYINTNVTDLINAIKYLETIGLIVSGRANEILK